MFKHISAKIQITLIGGISTILAGFAIILYVSFLMKNEAISQAKQNVLQIAKENSSKINAQLEIAMNTSRTLSNTFSTQITNDKKMTRKQVNSILKSILANNKSFLGTYTVWEPNAFDGKDSEFVNTKGHDKTGRFIPYWVRTDNGSIEVEALVDYEKQGLGDYYQIPKRTKKEAILEPFLYNVQGEVTLLTSLVVPIISSDKVYGMVGVDFSLSFLQSIADDLDIYEKTGTGAILTYEGMISGITNQPTLVGHSSKEIFPKWYDSNLKLIKNSKEFTIYNPDDKYFIAFAPMQIGKTQTPWSVMIKVPEKKVLEYSYSVLLNLVIIGVILTMIILLLFMATLKKIIHPLLELIKTKNIKLEESLSDLKQTQKHMVETEKMASLGGLVAGVAHEINTPIGLGITGMSHFVEETNKIKNLYDTDNISKKEFESYLEHSTVLANITLLNLKKSASLVKSFKQISVDQTNEDKREFNLKTYVEEVLLSLYYKTKRTSVKINVNCPSDILIVSFPGAFSQIVTNLILNSLVHAYDKNEKGVITLDFKLQNSQLIFVYKDDGKGIEEKNLNKIFDPFFTTNRSFGGSGLGLNIIFNIVTQKLKGTIKCKSKEKEGVEFIIEVPITIKKE